VHPDDLAQGCSDLEMTWLLCCAGATTGKMAKYSDFLRPVHLLSGRSWDAMSTIQTGWWSWRTHHKAVWWWPWEFFFVPVFVCSGV